MILNSYFCDSMKFVFKIFRCIGVVPLKESLSNIEKLIFQWKSREFVMSYLIFILLFLFECISSFAVFRKASIKSFGDYLQTVKYLHLLQLIFALIIHIVLAVAYKNMNDICVNFDVFDMNLQKRFQSYCLKFEEEKYIRHIIKLSPFVFLFLTALLVIVLFNEMSFLPNAFRNVQMINNYVQDVPVQMNFITIGMIIYAIHFRLAVLSKLIECFKKTINEGGAGHDHPTGFIKKLKCSYMDLIGCSSAVNAAYGPYQLYLFVYFIYRLSFQVSYSILAKEIPSVTILLSIKITYYALMYILMTFSAGNIEKRVSFFL